MSAGVREVDARGKRCPLPVIMLAGAARGADPGAEFRVLSTDPAAGPDIAAWCRMRGHVLADQYPEGDGDVLVSIVRLGEAAS